MRAALYLRVSTDSQDVANQRRELEAVAQRHGWEVVGIFSDKGVSGAKDRRPGFDRLRKGIMRKEFDLVAAWSVDRLGRSLQNLLGFLGELQAKRVDLYLHQQGLDTQTAAGRAMFQMCGVFAEFERAMIVSRVKAGLARARANGVRLGPPRVEVDLPRAQALLAEGQSLRAVSKTRHQAGDTSSVCFHHEPRPGRHRARRARRAPGRRRSSLRSAVDQQFGGTRSQPRLVRCKVP
jgi:DNA invertase Pin-like site-specific DNA recombinase